MDKSIRFANRSGFNLRFYKYDSRRADYGFKADEAPLVVDFVNSCTLETTGETVWATGGQGFKRLIGFDNPLEGTFNIETQITNTPVWAMVAGQDPANFDPRNIKFTNRAGKRKYFYVVECDTMFVDEDGINYVQEVTLHKVSVNRAFNATYTGDGDPQSITIVLDLAENGDDDLVTMKFEEFEKDEELTPAPIPPAPEPPEQDPEDPPIYLPFAIDGAQTKFEFYAGGSEVLMVADFIDENGAPDVVYRVCKSNKHVTVSEIIDGGFIVDAVSKGSTIVTLKAVKDGKTVVSVEIYFVVNLILPIAVIGAQTTFDMCTGHQGFFLTSNFIDENGAKDVKYAYLANCGTVAVFESGPGFIVDGIFEGTAIVTIKALINDVVKLVVELTFNITQSAPVPDPYPDYPGGDEPIAT